MNTHELIGYLASLLVLMTFCMSGMVSLRALAIASNMAFIAYGALAGISPVLLSARGAAAGEHAAPLRISPVGVATSCRGDELCRRGAAHAARRRDRRCRTSQRIAAAGQICAAGTSQPASDRSCNSPMTEAT